MLCDENILWSQAVFEVFYSPGSFRCAEKYLVGCWPFWFATEVFCERRSFRNLGKKFSARR